MACDTINPRWTGAGVPASNAIMYPDGTVMARGGMEEKRDFMLPITEGSGEEQKAIVELLYEQTQRVVLLVRDRLEREKPWEVKGDGKDVQD
jgi:hypothetical protein